ncbi:hypothetical protein [Legionella erythra]|uniref:Glycine-rich protein n=1 Tax=Legionella erythra TaxID=448 RepID=A0A0W0TVE9_LEGER|nr:hypothetical protein [Legionella erythra]KTC99338.1 hypothetical protein Lery_0239 [Legionella erythra]
MNTRKGNAFCIGLFLVSLLASFNCQAWSAVSFGVGWYGGNTHYHPGYGPRAYYYGPGPGPYWGPPVPNVIINVPVENYYVPRCQEYEVCDNYYDECWIERRCN